MGAGTALWAELGLACGCGPLQTLPGAGAHIVGRAGAPEGVDADLKRARAILQALLNVFVERLVAHQRLHMRHRSWKEAGAGLRVCRGRGGRGGTPWRRRGDQDPWKPTSKPGPCLTVSAGQGRPSERGEKLPIARQTQRRLEGNRQRFEGNRERLDGNQQQVDGN